MVMRWLSVFFLFSLLTFCSPKGPQTYSSPFIGKSKQDLIAIKGVAKEIRIYDNSEVYIYKTREEYFGKKLPINDSVALVPKKVYIIEYIYHINKKGYIYKYQVWKKRVD